MNAFQNDNRSHAVNQDIPQSPQSTAENARLHDTANETAPPYIDTTADAPQASSKLETRHIEHLRSEGFTDAQILDWEKEGLRSLSAAEAEKLEFKVKTSEGLQSGDGLYFPFDDGFGQLRLDEPIQRANGKGVKYLTPLGAKSKARLPNDCKAVTEGAKDGHAGTVHGGIPTGAIAGVSHYRKALKEGAGYTVLFDSDGWHNPSVFSNLFHAGKWLNGKIQLIPFIPNEPKAGLCEYFKAGYNAEDYAALIASAMTPEAFLMAWPQHFGKIPTEKLLSAIKVAFRLGAEYLDDVQLELLLNDIRKTTKLSAGLLRDKLEEQKQIVEFKKRQPEASHENQSESPLPKPTLRDPNWVDTETVEVRIFDTLFEGGDGSWTTIDDTFYQHTGNGHWKRISDKKILKAIALKCKSSYKVVETKQGAELIYPFGTEQKKQSTFKFCRDALGAETDSLSNNHLRCFLNCTVDLRTGKTLSHDKSHFLTTAIAADYIPNQSCPDVFLKFIAQAYGEDLIEAIRAYTSMLIDPTAPYGIFVHLLGASGSGKGTLLRLWGEMFGLDHFRSGSFNDLSTAEGRHQFLTGAALFAVPDCGGFISGLKSFYELVDNGPMTGRALFSPTGYQKLFNTRFVVASVGHLQIENAGDGWDRRCRPLPTKARTGIEDPYLGRKLAEVKAQIISWALGMPREERDRLILQPSTNERVLALKQDAAIHGDPVRAYIDLCLRPEAGAPNIQSHELHSRFAAFAQAHGYQSWGMSKLISHLKAILPDHYVARKKKDGEYVPAHWRNIIFLLGAFIDISLMGRDEEWEQRQQPLDPQWKCVKSECVEGGLLAFKEFRSGNEGWTTETYGYQISSIGTAGTAGTPAHQKVTVPGEPLMQQALQDIGTAGTVGTPTLFRFLKKREEKKEEGGNHNPTQGATVKSFPLDTTCEISNEATLTPAPSEPTPLDDATESKISKNSNGVTVPGVPAVPQPENTDGVKVPDGTPTFGDVTVPGVPGVPIDEIGYQYVSSVHPMSPQAVALRTTKCESWEEFEKTLDAVGKVINKDRVTVYKGMLVHLSFDDRQHLVRLLADHIQQFPRDRWCYSWLPRSSQKLVDKAIALSRGEAKEESNSVTDFDYLIPEEELTNE